MTAEQLYKSLSEEFVRKGVASNRFSELNELFTWAQIGEEAKSEQSQLARKDQIIAELKRANDFYGDSKKYITTTVSRGGDSWIEHLLDDDGGKLAREVVERVKALEGE